MVQGIIFQGKGGNQGKFVGESGQSLLIGAQLQNDGILGHGNQLMLHIPGEAVLGGFIAAALGLDNTVLDLARVGEQDGGMVAPDRRVRLPDVLHAVGFPDNAPDLCAPGGDGQLQIFVFDGVFHGISSQCKIHNAKCKIIESTPRMI